MGGGDETAGRIIFVAGCAAIPTLCCLQAAVSVVGGGCLSAVWVDQSSTIDDANNSVDAVSPSNPICQRPR